MYMTNSLLILVSLWIYTTSIFATTHELAICAIFHNEDRFLKDWIEFHQAVGVEHFYLYNNQSTDNFREVLEPYIEKGVIDLIDWEYSYDNFLQWQIVQCNSYNDCLQKHKNESKWIAFLETYEFLYSPIQKDLKNVLKDYEKFDSIGVNCVYFGTSNIYELDPNISIIYQLIYRAPYDVTFPSVKNIVRPISVKRFVNSHFPLMIAPLHHINENKEEFYGPISKYHSINKLRINNYWIRDEKFFDIENANKISRKKDINLNIYNSILDTDIWTMFKEP
jgi:hypothetical protein